MKIFDIKFLVISFSMISFISCQKSPSRKVSSLPENVSQYVIKAYELENKVEKLSDIDRRTKKREQEPRERVYKRDAKKELQKEIGKLKLELNQEDASRKESYLNESTIPVITYMQYQNLKFNYQKKIKLTDKKLYLLNEAGEGPPINLTLDNAETYVLDFEQSLQEKLERKVELRSTRKKYSIQAPYLKSTFSCDGPFRFSAATFTGKEFESGKIAKFKWYLSSDNTQRIQAILTNKSGSCRLRFEENKKLYGLDIRPFSQSLSKENTVRRKQFEFCQIPNYSGSDALDSLFLTTDYKSLTCPQEIDEIRMLDDRIDGLNAKVQALLGKSLPKKMIETQNPYYPLDFNGAPKLDTIYISYLVFRRDFYGTVMERLLRYHAKRGTLIKIFTSQVISLDKDLVMLNDLENEFPNVMVKLYKFDSFLAQDFMEIFSQLHRTLHVKMFMTSSTTDPESNVAIIGGRNIHDGFVYNKQPDLSKHPHLVQYGKDKDENFAKWTDFEVELKGPRTLRSLMGHYDSLFEYDVDDFFFRSFTLNRRTNTKLDETYLDDNKILFRHFMSFPYKDDMALEKMIIELLDSANESITISTPYFNLTERIDEALLRAVERGVKIDVITRLDLEGDTADIILSDVNKKSVNKYVDNVTIYEYTAPKDILHSKLIVVDKKMTLVGSINFNQRSFYHDLENTLIIRSSDFSKSIIDLIDEYKKQAREITDKQKTVFWKSIVIGIFKKAL